jgi:hypothetical protein
VHTLSASFVLAYHGCDRDVAEHVLGGEQFIPSTNDYDWLGRGIYFWEANPKRGFEYAKELATRKRSRSIVINPAVVGAIVDLGLCLDLTTASGLERVRLAYQVLAAVAGRSSSGHIPKNNKDGLRRNLDCAVINTLHDINRENGFPAIDSVKGAFIEGDPIYPSASFHEKTHIQICVHNPACIKGIFRVSDSALL